MGEVRVGIIAANHFPRLGGMEFRNHMLARALAKQDGISVAVACATMRDVPRAFPYPYPVYGARSFSRLTRYLARRNVDRMIGREGVTVLHGATRHGAGVDAVLAGERHRLPVVVQSHGSDVQVVDAIGYGARLDAEQQDRIRFTLERASAVLAVSSMNRDMILAAGGPPERTYVAPPACAFDDIGAIPFEDLRPRYGLGVDDFVVVTVGRNRPIKRMPLLFEALAILKSRGRPVRGLCVGPEADLGSLAADHGIEDVVRLVGRVPKQADLYSGLAPPFPELVNLYRAADFYVSVSYFESFGLAAMDALACGTPVVVTPRHGIRDVIREGETGYVLRNESAESLADLLETLAATKPAPWSHRDAIRASVAHCTWDAAARYLSTVYARVLGQ